MKIIEYFNPQSTLQYMGAVAVLLVIPIFNTTHKQTFFIFLVSLIFIVSGIMEGYNRDKNEQKKEQENE